MPLDRAWLLAGALVLLGPLPRVGAQDWTVPFPPLPGEVLPGPPEPTAPAPSAPDTPPVVDESAAEPDTTLGGPCLRPAVHVSRAHAHPVEEEVLSLTRCDGTPNPDALVPLSMLARPGDADRPTQLGSPDDDEVAPGVRRLDPGLLTRLQALADRFPGAAIAIVSGYRPRSRRTSRHHTGRALDVAFEGVDRREVAEYARANLEATGVGYYPNSSFTHIDVRDANYAWIDTSGPGQRQRRRPWPLEVPAPPSDEGGDANAVAAAPTE